MAETKKFLRNTSSSLLTMMVTSGLDKTFDHLNKIKDPIVKYSLFLETVRVLFDTIANTTSLSIEDEIAECNEDLADPPKDSKPSDITRLQRGIRNLEKSKDHLEKLIENMDTYFTNFSDWIAQPIYSPDHPLGEKMMRGAKQSFASVPHTNE